MLLKVISSPGLAHTSYFFADKGEAFIIDPRRDIDIYLEHAFKHCDKIKYVFETHRNEDYLSGSIELGNRTEAEIGHSKELDFTYGDHKLNHDDTFIIGDYTVRCLWTPGHTVESMCYALYESNLCNDALAVFTGDTLFVGDVGRTDLSGKEKWRQLSGQLYESLHKILLPLGDHVLIYPSHSAGSICGSRISNRTFSSIGIEKRTNPQLALSRDDFIKERLGNVMPRPPYFDMMENMNLKGPESNESFLEPFRLTPFEFNEKTRTSNVFIMDTRQPDAYASSHVPNSVNIWLNGVTYYPGWLIGYNQKILLVSGSKEDAVQAATYLHRIGYDNIIGFLCPGIEAWRNKGFPTEAMSSIHVKELFERLEKENLFVLDVREDHEYDSGHIAGSKHIYVGDLPGRIDEIPYNELICVTCGWGGRAGIAASYLKNNGYRTLNLLGGMNAWSSVGLPVVAETKVDGKKVAVCPF